MSEWMSGLVVGVTLALVTQGAQSFFRHKHYRYQTLMERYADFVATASDELSRVKSVEAGLEVGAVDGDYSGLSKLNEQRHELRSQLSRFAFQIRILEKNRSLSEKVEKLAKSQAFMVLAIPPLWGNDSYNKRFDKFKAEIAEFEKELSQLVAAVGQRALRVWLPWC